jgi:DNA-binding CsgD family transcriptional regulator
MNHPVTQREMQIAELIYFGATEKEISNHLDIAIDTVKSHKRNLFVKTGSRNIADVTRWYVHRKTGVSINPSEIARKIMVCGLLFLILTVEISHGNFIRPRRSRTKSVTETIAVRRGKTSRKNYLMSA